MAKEFKAPSKRLPVADPDYIEIPKMNLKVNLAGLKPKRDGKAQSDYNKVFTNMRIKRSIWEGFSKLCDEHNIMNTGNYIARVLETYLEEKVKPYNDERNNKLE